MRIKTTVNLESFAMVWQGTQLVPNRQPRVIDWSLTDEYNDGLHGIRGDMLKIKVLPIDLDEDALDWLHEERTEGDQFEVTLPTLAGIEQLAAPFFSQVSGKDAIDFFEDVRLSANVIAADQNTVDGLMLDVLGFEPHEYAEDENGKVLSFEEQSERHNQLMRQLYCA